MFMVLMLNEDKMINPRCKKPNLSKQPNLNNLAVMRDQSPSFPKKQPKVLLFWGSVSHLQASISLKASETSHFRAAWVIAEPLSKHYRVCWKIDLPHPLLPSPFDKLINFHTKPKSHKSDSRPQADTSGTQCRRNNQKNHPKNPPDAPTFPVIPPVITMLSLIHI